MTIERNSAKWLAVAVALGLGAGALAQAWKKLPPDFAFPMAEVSPGQVTFKHATHVNAARPDCTACHPKGYRILQAGSTAQGTTVMKHAAMDKGEQCGACHGKTAFGFKTCEKCHQE